MSAASSFQKYVAQISKIPLLTKEQEKDLTVKYSKNKTQALKNKLITHNLRLVVKIAYEYSFTDKVEDLFQEGSIGLMRGVEKFDPTRGVRLGNYCYHWIRAYILRHIINNARLVKIGTTTAQRKLFFNLNKTKARYIAKNIDISDDELAEELGVTTKELQETEQRLFAQTVRLDVTNDIEGQTIRQGNFIERNRPDILEHIGHNPSELIEKMELKKTMDKLIPRFMNGLSDRDQIVFKRRMANEDKDTLDSIGGDLSLTRERIRQIESKLKGKFKRFLKTNHVSM